MRRPSPDEALRRRPLASAGRDAADDALDPIMPQIVATLLVLAHGSRAHKKQEKAQEAAANKPLPK